MEFLKKMGDDINIYYNKIDLSDIVPAFDAGIYDKFQYDHTGMTKNFARGITLLLGFISDA